MTTQLAFRAPARIDFGGGWTDVPPYPARDGGFVCNVAIARYATVRLHPAAAGSDDARATGAGGDVADAAIVRAALRRAGITGVRATLATDFPVGAGLGGSSAAGVAAAAAVAAWRNTPMQAHALAEWSRAVEVEELGIAGGRQDHYAAAVGGALALSFGESVDVHRIGLPDAVRATLERRLVLAYTGQSRISGDTITAVMSAYEARDARVLAALRRMAALARDMAQALGRGDVDTLGALVAEHWVHQRALHPAIATPRIDAILEAAARAGALGGKAMGASGGGCVLVIATDDEGAARVRAAVEPLGELLPFTIDAGGVSPCA